MNNQSENTEVDRQRQPERDTRPQLEREREPDYRQVQQEREGNSNWSGGSWGGRS